jgi:hypothetical protein
VKVSIGATAVVAMVLAAGCAGTAPTPTAFQAASPLISPVVSAPPSGLGSPAANPSAANATSDLVGSWHRAQTCPEMLSVFEQAGLAESHVEWLTGNFYGGSPAPTDGDVCKGARGPLEHSHFFTASGEFGSHDENGQQVDDGDYVASDANTLAFPSHATGFGYAGDLLVDYAIKDGVLTFDVALPQPCEVPCKDAYDWALSAFASGPWARGEVP